MLIMVVLLCDIIFISGDILCDIDICVKLMWCVSLVSICLCVVWW